MAEWATYWAPSCFNRSKRRGLVPRRLLAANRESANGREGTAIVCRRDPLARRSVV